MKPDLSKINEKFSSKSSIGEFIGKLLESRDVSHIEHWKTTSYAKHKALNKYYDGILDLTDSFTEAYQGEFGLIKGIKINAGESENITTYLKFLASYIKSNRTSLNFNTHLMNITDEMLELIFTTIYKLEFLS